MITEMLASPLMQRALIAAVLVVIMGSLSSSSPAV